MQITTNKQNVTDETGIVIRSMYFLNFKNETGKTLQINVGEKTHREITAMLKEEEYVTVGASEQNGSSKTRKLPS